MARPRTITPPLVDLPTAELAWEFLLEYARTCRAKKTPIRTLSKGVQNFITAVDEKKGEIRRRSDGSPKGLNNTPFGWAEFRRIWDRLRTTGAVEHKAHRFALAFICHALPDLVEFVGGATVVVRRQDVYGPESVESRYSESDARSRRWPQYRDYGEGFPHWVTKNYIADHPDLALSSLRGAPWGRVTLEFELPIPTRDRVDVLVYDHNNVPMVIEVKPEVSVKNIEYYAQAAKYRTIWQVLTGRPWVRCVVAAPSVVDDALPRRMLNAHDIETVEVDVPDSYQQAKRPEWERENAVAGSRDT